MTILQKFKAAARNPKVQKLQMVVGFAIATTGALLPDDSKSYNYCNYGSGGDCEWTTRGNEVCEKAWFGGDCQ
ncbi:hypothetical protein [Xanthocytophaga agilis]|uniref:Uncharacterized protein n=1 Tax=Xanthocytophaga agilis TaxID=3048010 RepID=A0AAE3R9L5_9BACT|nr:hypothetical protein [Xanthocytophaga agilis]MDJ1505775.1 hypothetical protein [Xanthocytophaga agilis]